MPIALHRVCGRGPFIDLVLRCDMERVHGLSVTGGILNQRRGQMQAPGATDQQGQDEVQNPALAHRVIIGQQGIRPCHEDALRLARALRL